MESRSWTTVKNFVEVISVLNGSVISHKSTAALLEYRDNSRLFAYRGKSSYQ
jgi:hypothetical protein